MVMCTVTSKYKPKCYLAGKMSGLPFFNFPAFMEAETKLENMGYDVFNPAKKDLEVFGDKFWECSTGSHEEAERIFWPHKAPTYRECLRIDLNWILDNAEAIAMIPGWEESKGANIEKQLAECLGLEVIYL